MEPIKKAIQSWDKYKSAIFNESCYKTAECILDRSVKKSRLITSRNGKKYTGERSFLVPKPLNSYRETLKTTPSPIRPQPSSPEINGLTTSEIQQIYAAKCIDLDIPILADQEKRFFSFCSSNLKNRKFIMRDLGLGLESAQVISKLIAKCTYFSYLDLSKNILKDEGIKILSTNLKKSLSIVHLDISSNEISAEGCEIFVMDLMNHQSLVSLDLSSHEGLHRNRLGFLGAKSLSSLIQQNKILQFLNLAGTGLGPEGLECLTKGLSKKASLISLNLSNNNIGSKPIEQLAKVLMDSNIQDLNLSLNKIGNEACEYIALMISGGYPGYCSVIKLCLAENEITTAGLNKILAAMRINSQIKQLDLQKNKFAKGLSYSLQQFLMENLCLESLNFSYCEIKSEGLAGMAEGLAKNSALMYLYLSSNNIQDRGAEVISSSLVKNKALKYLDISTNRITDAGGILLAKALQSNDFIETVILRCNLLRDESAQMLSEVSRVKKNIIKLSLELNPLGHRFIHEIKENTHKNYDFQQKRRVPELKNKIKKINFDSSIAEKLNKKISRKQKEKIFVEKKLEQQGNRLDHVKETEEVKLKELVDEYKNVREKNLNLSFEIEEIQKLINVRFN